MVNKNENNKGDIKKEMSKGGFSLVELIVVIVIIGLIATIIFVALGSSRQKARDVKRKAELTQFGRFMSLSCYRPDGGPGEYDIADLAAELEVKYPQYSMVISRTPRDPASGTDTESFYRYIVSGDGRTCALYANLEFDDEPVTLGAIAAPTAGGGTGVFEAASAGWNGTAKYFQISN